MAHTPTTRPKGPKPKRRIRQQPALPIRCAVVENMNRVDEFVTIYPSRTKAKKALAKLVRALPPKTSPDQPKRFTIRNL